MVRFPEQCCLCIMKGPRTLQVSQKIFWVANLFLRAYYRNTISKKQLLKKVAIEKNGIVKSKYGSKVVEKNPSRT